MLILSLLLEVVAIFGNGFVASLVAQSYMMCVVEKVSRLAPSLASFTATPS